MRGVKLDWSSAEVRESKLEVALRGELPPGWKDRFERTVALLGGGDWGKVKLKKDRVRVHEVAQGSEDRLHQFLEGVVLQANAAQEEMHSSEAEDRADEHEAAGPDAEMTERFRSFAKSPDH